VGQGKANIVSRRSATGGTGTVAEAQK